MWHWNSLWARAPGDPPTLNDPVLWTSPWTLEHALTLQARYWEAMLGSMNSWWDMMLATWPVAPPAWPTPDLPAGTAAEAAAHAPVLRLVTPKKLRAAPAKRSAKRAPAAARKR